MYALNTMNRNHQMNTYNPFREMENLERSFFGDPFGDFFNTNDLAEFKTDITDEGDHYLLQADLPGFDKKDINLNLNGDTLTIQAQRNNNYSEKDSQGKIVRMERSYGTYARQFNVSEIDTDHIRAAYDNGVLSLTMPKRNEVLPESRTLEIE